MKMLVVLVALMIMVRLYGQGTEHSLLNPASPDKTLVIFTYYRQFFHDLESVTFISNGRVQYATYYNRLKQGQLANLVSHVKSTAEFLIRLAFDKDIDRVSEPGEIVIPLEPSGGQRLYLIPEHRLIIACTGDARTFPRIKPILITESRLSVWLRITL